MVVSNAIAIGIDQFLFYFLTESGIFLSPQEQFTLFSERPLFLGMFSLHSSLGAHYSWGSSKWLQKVVTASPKKKASKHFVSRLK